MLAREIVDGVRTIAGIQDEARHHRVVGDARERDAGARERHPGRLDVVSRLAHRRVDEQRADRRERLARERRQVARRRGVELSVARLMSEREIPGAPGCDSERDAGELRLGLQGDQRRTAQLLNQRGETCRIVDDRRIREQRRSQCRSRCRRPAGFVRGSRCDSPLYHHGREVREFWDQRAEFELGEERRECLSIRCAHAELLEIELDRHVATQCHELAREPRLVPLLQ